MDVPEFIPDRRFVWKPAEPDKKVFNPTPPASDDERHSRRDKRKVPKLETEMLPEMERTSSPYTSTKQAPLAHNRSSGEYFFSPEALTPPHVSASIARSKNAPTSQPKSETPQRRTGGGASVDRIISQAAYGGLDRAGNDVNDDDIFAQRRTPARYSYTRPDADVSQSSNTAPRNVSSADHYTRPTATSGTFTKFPLESSPQSLPERTRRAAPPQVTSLQDSAVATPRSRQSSESRSAQASREQSPGSSPSYFPPSPPRSPGLAAQQARDPIPIPRSVPDSRPVSRGSSLHSSPYPSPRLSDSFPADYMLNSFIAPSAAYRPQQPSRLSSFTRADLPSPALPSGYSTPPMAGLPYPVDNGVFQMPSEIDHQFFPDRQSGLLPAFSEKRPSSRAGTPSGPPPSQRQAPTSAPRSSARESLATPLTSPRSSRPVSVGRDERNRTRTHAELSARPLPPCPRSEYSSKYDDWYTIEGSPFDICPDCFDAVFEDTLFRTYFKRAPRRGLDRELIKCDFSDPWIRLAWLLTLQRKLPSLSLIRSIAHLYSAETDRPCPGCAEAVVTWHSVRDRDGHFLRGFTVCPQDVKKIEILLPGFRGLLVPLPMRPSSAYGNNFDSVNHRCSLRAASNNRFPLYLDYLTSLHEPAFCLNRLPDVSSFISLVRHKTMLHECSRDDMLYNQRWHFIPSLSPAFTVCEDCYDEVVDPHVQTDSDVAMRFNRRTQLVHGEGEGGLSCQLYSPYMRRVFKQAVKDNDMRYLTRKAEQRKATEDRLQERVTSIRRQSRRLKGSSGYGRDERVDDQLYELNRELETIAAEWRRCE